MSVTIEFYTEYGAAVHIECETPEDAAKAVEDAQKIGIEDVHVEGQN